MAVDPTFPLARPDDTPATLPLPGGYEVGAYGAVRVPSEEVAVLRKTLGPPGGPPFPVTYLKCSEDQTVAAVAALVRAVEDFGLGGESFAGWGLIAAPRSLGRLAAADALCRYAQGGSVKISPFIVPHRSLHSVSGTISQGFNIRGPNFGVGGHAGAVAEGLLTTLALLEEEPLPGAWLVLTEGDPEPVPDAEGLATRPVVYHAVALAFLPAAVSRTGLRLRLVREGAPAPAVPPTVASLAEFLGGGAAEWSWPLGWGATLCMTRAASQTEALPRRAA